MTERTRGSFPVEDRAIAAALHAVAGSMELPEQLRRPGAAVQARARQRRKLPKLAAAAAVVAALLLTARLTAMAQDGIPWPWHREPPSDAATAAATQAYAADSLAVVSAVRTAEATAPAVDSLSLADPIRPAKVVDPFGPRKHPTQPLVSRHTGVDFAAGVGDPIYAAAAGAVAVAGSYPALGNVIVITHGRLNGAPVSTWYAHAADLSVAVGQQVKQGDLIAHAGDTGATTGPQLHFEVRVGDEPVDPMDWLHR